MIAEKLEGFGETVLELIGEEKLRSINPVVFETNFLKNRLYTPTSNLQGDIYDAITQYKYLIVVHENLDPTAENYIRLDTYNQSGQKASRLRGKYYTTNNGTNPQLQPLANFEDINGKISANTISDKGFLIAVFDLTRENNFNYIKYKITWINGFPTLIGPKLTFFGTNDQSYNFFKSDNPDNAQLVKVDGLQNLGTEATLQAVLTACQNIKISADSVNLNVDQVEAKLDTVASKLEDIKTNQTNKTQFAKLTDGVDDLGINPDGSINVNGAFGKNITPLFNENLATVFTNARDISPLAKNFTGLLLKITNASANTGNFSGIKIITDAKLTSGTFVGANLPYYVLANNAGFTFPFQIGQLQQNTSGFSGSISGLEVTYLYFPNSFESNLKFYGQRSSFPNSNIRVDIYGVNFDINQLLPKSTAITGVVETTTQQINPTDKYNIARTDSANAIKYFGFVDKDGNYYIMKQDSTLPVETFTYAIGINFITDWANRASLVYQEFNDVF